MSTVLLSILVVALAVAGMSAGVLMGRGGIVGSCGGAAGGCELCAARRCRRRRRRDA